MNKLKQCTYTVILLFSCIVASPMIFKQIWTTSAEKKKETPKKNIEIDINQGIVSPTGDNIQPPVTQPAPLPGNAAVTDIPITTDASGSEITTTTTEAATADYTFTPEFNFVKSDYSYFADALFIGDSRTVGIDEYGSLGNADFFCDVGLTSQGAYASSVDGELASMLNSNTYGKIYIMLGINEVGNNFDTTFSNFRKLVENVQAKAPDAIIYLQANLHVTAYAENGGISNERIDTLNGMIRSLADNKKIFYLDINPIFDDGYGNLREDCTGDGVHVYAKFYTSWSDWYCLNTVPEQTAAPVQPITDAPAG